ncbi:MAG: sensor histidine kinase [Frankia sp.]
MSLCNRIALAGAIVVLAVAAVASLAFYPLLSARIGEGHDTTLTAAAAQAINLPGEAAAVPDGGPSTSPTGPSTDSASGSVSGSSDGASTIVRLGGTILQVVAVPVRAGKEGEFLPVSARDAQVAAGSQPAYFQSTDYDGVRYRVYTAALGASGQLVRTAVSLSSDGAELDRLRLTLAGLTVGAALLAGAGSRLAAGRVLRPVGALTGTVEHITATLDLSAPVEAAGRDEIGRLARSFATMMAALDVSVETQRRLVADASHELRTPLTSLTTNLELLEEDARLDDPAAPDLVRDARRQAHELTALINDLVDLGRYGQGDPHVEDIRLDLLAARVVARATTRDGRIRFRTELVECIVTADPDAVERAVGNLVDNAVKWSPAGGTVLVAVYAGGSVYPGGSVTVSDEGPGIPADDVPYVFDRFYRSPRARSFPGSGLGLAIVRQIAETHGGSVAVEPRPVGARLRLTLPTADVDRPPERPRPRADKADLARPASRRAGSAPSP